MAERKSVSMQDLADKLGISKVTVSKALNGKDGVGEELKEKIFALARESGYVLPDYGKRKSKKVGIIMSPRFSSGDEGKFYMAMYERIIYELQRASCSSIMISPTTATLPSDMNTIQTRGLFDGLIFLGILDKGVREQIAQIDLPKVYVDIYDRTHKSDSVITENIYSSYELTNYLIQQGHTDIGFVGTVGSTTSISDRYLGYLRRMLEEGISPKNEWRIPDRSEEGIAIPLLLPEKLPTAFVCNCDATAFKLVRALKERGICVPEDVSVTGFDDSIYAQLCSPSLTTVAVDTDAIARLAAKRMIKHMNEPQKKSGEVYRIPGKIIYRDSVCKINGSSDKPEQSGEGSKKKKGRWTKNDTELTVMALPTTIWYILFCFLPMFGLIIAFKNYKITGGKSFIYNLLHSDWAGFKNFSFLIRSNDLFVILRNTILYNLAFIVLGMVFSVGLAIMISLLHNKRASKVYQTMMFFPYFMSWVVASYFLDAFLNQDNGLINSIMRNAGKEPIQWYMSAGVWPFILIFMYLWKSTGYNMVIYLSSISGIDTTLYEAAVMDGANKRQQVWHITLPCLKSVIIMMFILNVGKVFYSDFGLFFQLSQGASGSIFKTTATIDTYVYNALQSSTPIGMTSAATFFQSVACCITILLANAIVKKIDEDSAII